MTQMRTAGDFVEDLLSNGKDADYIVMVANNTYWRSKIDEVVTELKSFSTKFKKRFVGTSKLLR